MGAVVFHVKQCLHPDVHDLFQTDLCRATLIILHLTVLKEIFNALEDTAIILFLFFRGLTLIDVLLKAGTNASLELRLGDFDRLSPRLVATLASLAAVISTFTLGAATVTVASLAVRCV